ncbi:hypothetical protein [Peijinzhouia sedimentorum]
MKYFLFLILFCAYFSSLGQYKLLLLEDGNLPKGAEIQQSDLENTEFAIALDSEGNLLEWSNSTGNKPLKIPAEVLKLADFETWQSKWLNPYFGMSPSTIQYLRSDSMAALLEMPAMEMPMPSSSQLYSSMVGLTWTPDDSVRSWEVEFRNQYDETVGVETVEENKLKLVLDNGEKVSVYVRNPRTMEGSGVFVLNGMTSPAKEKYAGGIRQIIQASGEASIASHLLKAAYFESKGLYVDALSEYVLLTISYPDEDFAEDLLRWYIFRHAFRPWF